MYLIYHITLLDQVIKGSFGFTERKSSLYVSSLPGFSVISIVVAEIYFLIHHVTACLYDLKIEQVRPHHDVIFFFIGGIIAN